MLFEESMLQFDDELTQRLGLPVVPVSHLDLDLEDKTYTDSNNNNNNEHKSDSAIKNKVTEKNDKRGDKYSLRPRSLRNRRHLDQDEEENVQLSASTKAVSNKSANKSRTSKPKQKAAPLSKYRRKTANARERSRMREINQAFEALRKAVPQTSSDHQTNEKLTKITTLRLAMKYISTLSAVLSANQDAASNTMNHKDFLSDCSELDCFLLESDGESLPALQSDLSDHSLTPADFSMDFPDDSLTPVDFAPLSPDLTEHLNHFDTFLVDFS